MLSTRMPPLRRVLLCALAAFMAAPLLAQTIAPTTIKFAASRPTSSRDEFTPLAPPALPDWPDEQSVRRLAHSETTGQANVTGGEAVRAAPALLAPPTDALPANRGTELAPAFVTPASAEIPVTQTATADSTPALDGLSPARDPRQLGPPKTSSAAPDTSILHPAAAHSFLPDFGLPLEAMYTTGTALAIVVGLFLLCVWALRRGARKSTVMLSADVARVLGRVPLAARQFAELLHVGNKIVLISVTASGAELLTEISDPVEVDRLLGICKQKDGRSSTAEFDEMFRQLTDEIAPDGFLGEETIRLDAGSAAGAYAAQRGGRRSA
ncbi:MAG TPA: flagellar biosynthetic protein FliO [Lacipirellulaceae bacterium]|jgi:flagellar biogenesis protein FliO